MEKFARLNSKLYADLLQVGGDSLVAAYSHLKVGKSGAIKFYKESNKSALKTVSIASNISVSTLKKYIAVLQEIGLVYFDGAGNFVLLGGNKINRKYKKKRTVRVLIGKSLIETKLNSFALRIRKMHQSQCNIIDRKDELKKIMWKNKKNIPLTPVEFKLHKRWGDTDLSNYKANTVLSNQGYSKLKSNQTDVTVSKGFYWKRKLVKAKIIKTRRKFKFLTKCTYQEYRKLKFKGYSNTIFKGGKVFLETASEFILI
jgi:hypothetical protein